MDCLTPEITKTLISSVLLFSVLIVYVVTMFGMVYISKRL